MLACAIPLDFWMAACVRVTWRTPCSSCSSSSAYLATGAFVASCAAAASQDWRAYVGASRQKCSPKIVSVSRLVRGVLAQTCVCAQFGECLPRAATTSSPKNVPAPRAVGGLGGCYSRPRGRRLRPPTRSQNHKSRGQNTSPKSGSKIDPKIGPPSPASRSCSSVGCIAMCGYYPRAPMPS